MTTNEERLGKSYGIIWCKGKTIVSYYSTTNDQKTMSSHYVVKAKGNANSIPKTKQQ